MHRDSRFAASPQALLHAGLMCLLASIATVATAATPRDARVLLVVWDGLRPDLINAEDTPVLAGLRDHGVEFTDHHSTWPTLTMVNASSFATGAYPGTHGFYGNWLWLPHVHGRDSLDRIIDFQQPVFTEDYAMLQAIDAAEGGRLFSVPTIFEVAERAGLGVAVIGKGGPTYVQNRHGRGAFLDDRTAMPRGFAAGLAQASLPLPRQWRNAYPADPEQDSRKDDDPTANGRLARLKDGVTSDPTAADVAPFTPSTTYLARVLNEYVLPQLRPQLAMLWLRTPDAAEHAFGPGSAATRAAARATDAILGSVLQRLDELGLRATTNVMVVSDHGHSHVSGPFDQFPLRAIRDGVVGAADPNGYSVSGEVRTVDLMRRAGLLAYDGFREQCSPVMSGIGTDGLSIYLHKPVDADFTCKAGNEFSGDFLVPGRLPEHTPFAVVAPDGGSEFIYVPSRNRDFVARIVRFLQSRKQYGAVFVDTVRYGDLPGTLPLSAVHLANAQGKNPDIIVSFNFDANASIGGKPGIEYTSSGGPARGTHGSFSPRDVHNVLIASGPAFKPDFQRDELPTANVDVAPTIAAILGLRLPTADGRPLNEALRDARSQPQLAREEVLRPRRPATGLQFAEPSDPDGRRVDAAATQYTIELRTRLVRDGGRDYRYFDTASGVRF